MNAIYITAISTLLGVALTLFFTNRRERNRFLLDNKHKEYLELREFYVELLASLDKTIRLTESGESYINMTDEMSLISSKSYLIASENINNKLIEISILMFEWSSLYKKSLPKKVGDSNFSIRTSEDSKYRIQANEINPELRREIGKLIDLIKEELMSLKSKIN
ncbi:hypothetical protein FLGE108171_16050 [Flavobacterium gelidilacus]|uniref:hypothetical protein n=1 Tax=Flavobacterium gelidilacus TaxID=206041 RepID=UPI0039EFFF4A